MPKLLNVGIKAVIVSDSKALLLKRQSTIKPEVKFWDLPGGRIDDDEQPLQALKRELKEEILNLGKYTVGPLLNIWRLPMNFPDGVGLLFAFYRVDTSNLKKVELSDEHEDYSWVSLTDLNKLESYDKKLARMTSSVVIGEGYRLAVELALRQEHI